MSSRYPYKEKVQETGQNEEAGDRTMGGDRNNQGTEQGLVLEEVLSEDAWRVLILASTAAVLLFSIYCLSHGITIIFMHLYYFPIVLLAYRYRYRGFVLATLLALAYVGLVVLFHPEQAEVTGAFYRFAVFIGIAAVVAYLSERLAAAHISQKEGLGTIQNLQQFQESVITNANVWITVLAPDGTILVWNDAAEAISGYKRGDVLGMKTVWKNFYPDKEYRHKVTREIQRVIDRDTFLENFETEIRCADGTQKTIVWNTRGIRDAAGTIQSYIAIGRNITEQKRAEKALRERETLLNEVGEMAHVGGWELDVRTKAVHWTTETYRIHDMSEDERFDLSKAVLFFDIPGRSRLEGALQRCMETGEPFDLELPFTSAKSRHLWTRAMGRAVSVGGKVVKLMGTFQDITERKKAEQALAESGQRIIFSLESAEIGAWDLDLMKHTAWRSLRHDQIFGYEELLPEWTYEMFLNHVLPEDRSIVDTKFGQALENFLDWDFECRIRRKDGAVRWIWAKGRPEFNDLNEPEKMFGIVQDVTERKQAEEALRENEEKYREFFTTSRDCVFITSPGGQWIDFNDVALEMFGFTSREELKKVPISQLYENPSERTAFLNLIIQQGFVKEFPVKLRRKDGTVIDTLITTVAQKNPNGSPRSFVGTVRDITDRKRAEDALRQSEDRYRTLAEASPDQIFIVGRDDTMKYANPAALKLFRLPYDQVIGTPRKNLFPPDIADAQGILLKKVFETGEIARKEELIQFGKLKIWIDTNLVPLKDEAGTVTSVLGIARDITERKVSEEEISNLQAFQESVIANANVWITVLDPKGTILVWNDAAESITGYKRGDVLGKRTVWRDLYPDKEYRDKVTSEIIRIIGQDSYLENFETEIRCADKTQKAIVWNTRGIRDRTGTIQSFIAISRDITEQRRAEKALWESREHYRAIIDYSQIAIAVLDTNYKIIMVNPKFSKLFKKPVEDFVGKYCFNEFEKREAVCAHCPGMRSMVSGKPEEVETEGVRDDGSRFFVHNRTVPFFGPDGTVKGFVEMVEDITDRKQVEEALKKNQIQLAEAMDLAHLVNWELDVPTGIFTFDDRFYALYGTTAEREGGNKIPAEVYAREFVHPDDQHMVADEVKKAIESPDPGFESQVEHRIIRRDGEIRHIVVRFGITKDANGRTIKTHGGNQDITDRKQAELSIHESERRYRTLIDSAAEGILVIDNETHKFRHTNPAICSMLGYSEEELIRLGIEDITPKESLDYVMGEFMAQVRGEKTLSMNIPLLRKDKTILYTDVRSARIFIDEKMSDVGFFTDITERKKAEDLLKRFNEELEQQVKSRTEELDVSLKEKEGLLKEIHHRVRNNLQVVSSIISLQAKSVSDPATFQQIQAIRMRIGTLALVHEIAYLAKTPESINMRDFLTRCTSKVIDEFKCEPGRINVTITAENVQVALSQAVPCSLIVNELLMNSIRHAFPNKRHGEIKIGFSIAKGNYVLEYSDDGVGFPEGMHPQQAETGGLFLIHGLASQIRGTVESTTRPGTGYTLTFPAEIREGT